RGEQTGAYAVGTVRLDGKPTNGLLADASIGPTSRIDVELLDRHEPAAAMREVLPSFGPDMPTVTVAADTAGVRVTVAGPGTPTIYRNGARVAPGSEWIDRERFGCWSAETVEAHGDVSQRSPPACILRTQTIAAAELRGGTLRSDDRPHVTD